MITIQPPSAHGIPHSQRHPGSITNKLDASATVKPNQFPPNDQFILSGLTFSGSRKKQKAANQTAEAISINDLPPELLLHIVAMGSERIAQTNGDSFALLHFLSSLKCTSRTFQDVISQSPPHKEIHSHLQSVLPTYRMVYDLVPKTFAHLPRLTSILKNIPPQARQTVVDVALDQNLSPVHKTQAIQQLSSGIKWLSPQQHNALLQAVLEMQDAGLKYHGIVALNSGIPWFTEQQRNTLLQAGLGLQNEELRAIAIGLFNDNTQHLSERQRNTLLQAAFTLQDQAHKDVAIFPLFKQLQYLNDTQKGQILENVLACQVEDSKMLALLRLSENLQHLNPEQRKRLVEGALAFDYDKSRPMAGFGKHFQLLSRHEQTALIRNVNQMAQDMGSNRDDQEDVAFAIAGLSQGLPHLSPAQRQQFIDYTEGLTNETAQELAIIGLTAHNNLAVLTRYQQSALVHLALNLQDPANKNEVLFHFIGLLQLLDPTLRLSVVQAAMRQPDSTILVTKTLQAVSSLPAGDRGQLMIDWRRG